MVAAFIAPSHHRLSPSHCHQSHDPDGCKTAAQGCKIGKQQKIPSKPANNQRILAARKRINTVFPAGPTCQRAQGDGGEGVRLQPPHNNEFTPEWTTATKIHTKKDTG